jgi:hypothetical protein
MNTESKTRRPEAVAQAKAKRVLVILWDRTSWHKSKTHELWSVVVVVSRALRGSRQAS